jgi:FtsZ-binding cell division protein ZapB
LELIIQNILYTTISKFNSSNEGLYIDHTNDELVTIKASNGVWASAFMATSDKRIKENIINVSDNIALQKLRDISCVHYEYKDKFNKGSATTIGFIAQQVKEHIPMAVSIQQDTIPNEMRVIETPQWTEINDGSDNKFKLTISDLEDVSGNTKYRFYVSNDLSGNDECEKEIHSLEDEPNSFIFDQSWNNVFLYGKEVDDLHTLDKQKLFALNFSATQEIDRIQQRQIGDISLNQIEINEAKQKINLLETENTTLKDRVVNLETQNSTLLTRLEALEKKINDLS